MLLRPFGDVHDRLGHALHQRACLSKLHGLLSTLFGRRYQANGQYERNHSHLTSPCQEVTHLLIKRQLNKHPRIAKTGHLPCGDLP